MPNASEYTLLGFIVVVVLLAMREVFVWLRERSAANNKLQLEQLRKTQYEIIEALKRLEENHIVPLKVKSDTMFEWHDKSNEDGVKIWYIRKSIESAIKSTSNAVVLLAKNTEIQTRILSELKSEILMLRNDNNNNKNNQSKDG